MNSIQSFESFESGAFQFFAMVRMSDVDQRFGSLLIVLAEQIGDAVLGDDVMNMSSCRCHTGTGFQLVRKK